MPYALLEFSAVSILSHFLSEDVMVFLAVYPDSHVLVASEVVLVRDQGITIPG
jgi:hypothetical protein